MSTNGSHRNSFLKIFRGIDSERFLYFAEKSAPLAEFRVSRKLSMMDGDGTANITKKNTVRGSRCHREITEKQDVKQFFVRLEFFCR